MTSRRSQMVALVLSAAVPLTACQRTPDQDIIDLGNSTDGYSTLQQCIDAKLISKEWIDCSTPVTVMSSDDNQAYGYNYSRGSSFRSAYQAYRNAESISRSMSAYSGAGRLQYTPTQTVAKSLDYYQAKVRDAAAQKAAATGRTVTSTPNKAQGDARIATYTKVDSPARPATVRAGLGGHSVSSHSIG